MDYGMIVIEASLVAGGEEYVTPVPAAVVIDESIWGGPVRFANVKLGVAPTEVEFNLLLDGLVYTKRIGYLQWNGSDVFVRPDDHWDSSTQIGQWS